MKKISVVLFFLLLLAVLPAGSPVWSEDSTSSGTSNSESTLSGKKRNQVREAAGERKRKFEEAKEQFEKARQIRKETIEKAKVAFKERLAKIKNERKKEIVTKLHEKMARINKNRTDHWNKILERLASVLEKIKSRRDVLRTAGKDTAGLDSAISNAESSLAAAKTAVSEQASKEYIINVGTEETLRGNVGNAVKTEQGDLKSILEKVNSAKKSVHNALRELRKASGEKVKESPESSPSGESET